MQSQFYPKFFKYLILILFQELLFSSSYNIFGYILDQETKNQLADVNIYNKNLSIGTSTSNDGYFNLFLNNYKEDKVDLFIELIGYEKKIIPINLTVSICTGACTNKLIDLDKVYLNNQSIELETTHIHSNKDNSNQISDIIIGGSEFNKNLKGDLANTLSNQPNIAINSFGGATSKPSLRGFSGDRFLLTKDSNELGDLSQSSIDHAIALDMNEVNQIQIIRGPKALVFGPNTIGGVVNATIDGNPKMKVDKYKTKIIFGSESYSPESASLYNQGLYLSMLSLIPLDKKNQLNISISNRKNENQNTPLGILENTNSITKNYKLGYTYYGKQFMTSKEYYLNFVFEDYQMDYGIPPTPSGHTTGIDIPMVKKTFQLNYHQDLSLKTFDQVDVKYNFIEYEHQERINGNDNFEVLLAKKTSNLKLEFSSENFLVGSEFLIKEFTPEGFYLTPETDEINISFYYFYEKKYPNDLDLLTSFRFGYLSVTPGKYNYSNGNSNLILLDELGNPILDDDGNRISLVRDRTFKNSSFSFGVRKKINRFEVNTWFMHTMRAPRVEELYSDGPHLATYAFEIGNPNLKSEIIYGIENSIGYNSNFFDFSIVNFYNYSPYFFQMTKDGICEEAWDFDPYSIEDILEWGGHPCAGVDWIDWGSAPLGWLYEYSSKGNSVTIKGFELDFEFRFNNIHLEYNFSYVDGYNKTLELPLSYMNPTKEIINLKYVQNLINYNFRISKIHPQDKLGEFETYTSGAILTDFIFDYTFDIHNITVQVNNIFNEKYYNHLSRIKNFTPEPGRNIHFIYKIIF